MGCTGVLYFRSGGTPCGNMAVLQPQLGGGKNPGILISSQNLKYMKKLLKQIEKTDVGVYLS